MRINNHYGCFLRRIMLLLLCICLLTLLPACTQQPEEMSFETPREWTPVYNAHEHYMFFLSVFPIAFTERLTEEDIAKILPEKPLPFEVFKAYVDFREDRTVYSVSLHIGSEESRTIVVLGDGAVMNYCCQFREKGENKSPCGTVEYTLYEFDDLLAEAVIKDTAICARTNGAMNKQDFEAILECFSWYSSGGPDLEQIVPREH